jgi:hypothetical protein
MGSHLFTPRSGLNLGIRMRKNLHISTVTNDVTGTVTMQ